MVSMASSLGSQINLYISNEFTLMVEYKLGELGILKFYLAPRISDKDKENNIFK